MSGAHSLKSVPRATLARLPKYLEYFKEQKRAGAEIISAADICSEFISKDADPLDDLACIGAEVGCGEYKLNILIDLLNGFLECKNSSDAVIIGAGHLGKILLSYNGFAEYGLNIVAAFDINPAVIGTKVNGKQIFSVEKMKSLCERMNIHIGIITVPERSAQLAADLLVKCGIKAIWNFSQATLKLPEEIIVQDENIAASLAILSEKLRSRINSGD
ncbi:MAG: redox-sensing transcriptional repressor Rex [Oscillospiraceae bacterium]|nr:redox-sensing transcriptional repressor Rex [Oscillospiraceae bacterium]MDE6132911.1 redox-sensing transcriptional repressor Rex [Oscillospiraceae bacterium]